MLQALADANSVAPENIQVYADLDYLTRANDSFGHDGGKRLLVDAAQALDEIRPRSGRPLSLSVGIAESPLRVGEGLQQLLTQADAAMDANKKCAT